METNSPYFRELLPGTDEHRDFIQRAIVEQETMKLEALRGKLGRPIQVISNWVMYGLINADNPDINAVVIYEPDQVTAYETFERSRQEAEA